MKSSVVVFGNEKLATGLEPPRPLIRQSLEAAGYTIEASVTKPNEMPSQIQSKVAVLAAYGHILPADLIDRFPLGIMNLHPSLLPIYRGPTPIEQAVLDGTSETGITIMKVTKQMDSGPIMAQAQVQLSGDETKAELAEKLHRQGAGMIVEVLDDVLAGQAKLVDQDDTKATYCQKITKADGALDWTKSAEQLEREIRAYAGWPTSYTRLFDRDIIITQAHVLLGGAEPGAIDTEKAVGVIMVSTGNGRLCIDRLKPAGKRDMSAKEFLAGLRA